MPWMRLNPAAVVQQLRAEHGPGDEAVAEQALEHLRENLLSGVYVVIENSASGQTFVGGKPPLSGPGEMLVRHGQGRLM